MYKYILAHRKCNLDIPTGVPSSQVLLKSFNRFLLLSVQVHVNEIYKHNINITFKHYSYYKQAQWVPLLCKPNNAFSLCNPYLIPPNIDIIYFNEKDVSHMYITLLTE